MTSIFDLGDQYTEEHGSSSDSGSLLVEKDPDASFVAEFCAGYIFRMLIEYLRDTNTSGNLIVTRDHITYTQADGLGRLLNDVVIYTHELTKFQFNSRTPKIIVGINTNDFRNKVKNVRKKYQVTLYKEPGQDNLFMEIHGQSGSGGGNIITIESEHVSLTEVHVSKYSSPDNRPNCTISSEAFTEKCNVLKDSAVSRVEISGYPGAMVMLGRSESGGIARLCHLGDLPDDPDEPGEGIMSKLDISKLNITKSSVVPKFVVHDDLPISARALRSIIVDVSTIKALARLNNITPNGGTVKIYFERDKPVKLICHIGTFGQLTVFLKGIDNII